MEVSDLVPEYGLKELGLHHLGTVCWNLSTPALYEEAIRRYEGQLAHLGPLVVSMGQHTGRAAKDKYIVDEPNTRDDVWWGDINVRFPQENFDDLKKRMAAYLRGKTVYVQDCYVGADEEYQIAVRVITEYAWHSLFARNMFIQQPREREAIKNFKPDFTVLHCANFHADPDEDGTRSGTFVTLDLGKKMILIGGTAYGGEIKKSVFSAMNYMLPGRHVLSMHCSANVKKEDPSNVAIFFGLSGTGKTTLSADPNRLLIGDDEHGWSENGIFNFEGGCYAKTINLKEESEPEIYGTTQMPGTILENVVLDADRKPVFEDDSLTQNTRCAYPIHFIPNASKTGRGNHPENIVFLTADAFGILPPISRLTPEQAMYHFISGYTAKVAGTERGVTEPQATFSACFGAPFMPLHPTVYAELLAEKINKHNANVWLVNTGWTGGPYGTGHRMKLAHTRKMLSEALNGNLENIKFTEEPIFGLSIPEEVEGIPSEILNPRNTWNDKEAYDKKANQLADMFNKNFDQFKKQATDEILEAGPV